MANASRWARGDTRRRLLEARAAHVAREGLERVIADRCRLCNGHVVNYVDSKDAVFWAVIAEGARRAADGHDVAGDRGRR